MKGVPSWRAEKLKALFPMVMWWVEGAVRCREEENLREWEGVAMLSLLSLRKCKENHGFQSFKQLEREECGRVELGSLDR